jgi:osmotically-inducible protein OsmY
MILSRSTRGRRIGRWTERGVLLTTGAAAVALASRLDRRRRHEARDRATSGLHHAADRATKTASYAAGVAKGAAHQATAPLHRDGGDVDDVTLARKVETEIFRPADAPKDKVSVNVAHGVVELRGEVEPDVAKSLVAAAGSVDGVRDVVNLLHAPGTPAPHPEPRDPEDVKSRAT